MPWPFKPKPEPPQPAGGLSPLTWAQEWRDFKAEWQEARKIIRKLKVALEAMEKDG